MSSSNYFNKFFTLAIFLLASGLLINYALPPMISKYIDTQIALSPHSQSYPMWKEPPVPIYQKFYFFNVTNAQDIEQRGHKPRLEEIGPFTYRSEWTKRDIESEETANGNTIRFKHFKEWHFEPEMSIADHKIQLVTLNAPLAITLTLIQSASNAVRLLVTFSLDGLSEGFFTKRTVKQLLFDGYPDLLTTFGPLLNAEMLSQGGHFGYMNARNNNLDGQYEINSGLDDISKLNTINRFNGLTKLPYWNHPNHHNHQQHSSGAPNHCNNLEGATTGDMFPPVGDNQTTIKLFQPDFCRVWSLDYVSQFEQAESGLRLKRFKATRDVFRNSSDLPENSCFFPNKRAHAASAATATNRVQDPQHLGRQRQQAGNGNGNSNNNNGNNNNQHNNRPHHGHSRVRQEWPAGVFTLAPCKFNAPIYISMPHFLDADPYFRSQVEGLEPDPERHEFYLDLEPRTGSPVTLSARVQINVAISKPPGLVRFRNVPEIMFPVFWQELTVNVSGPVIEQLFLASRGALEATERIAFSFILLGAVVLLTSAIFYTHLRLNGSTSSSSSSVAKTTSDEDEVSGATPSVVK